MNINDDNVGFPEDPNELLAGLRFDDSAPVPTLPSTAEIEQGMVPTSFKWPVELRNKVKKAAEDQCIPASMLIRRYIEEGLARELTVDDHHPEQLISVDEAIRAATRALSSLKHTA
jgi:hypothetical protein